MAHVGKNKILIFLVLLAAALFIWAFKSIFLKADAEIAATGTIEATSVNIVARQSGPIAKLLFSEGDTVHKSDLVCVQERNDLYAQRERDALALTKAEMSLKDLLSGAQIQEIESAQASVDIAEKKVSDAESDYLRFKELYEKGGCSKIEFEKYETQYKIAQDELASSRSKLNLIKAGARNHQIDAAQAEVDRSRAVLKASDAILADLKLYSPIPGRVISKNYEEGEYVSAGSSIMTIADLDDLYIKVYIPTDDLPSIKLGQKVLFTVSGSADKFEGIIESIADKGEFTPKTIQTKKERTNIVFRVKIKISSGGGILKPGMPADVVF